MRRFAPTMEPSLWNPAPPATTGRPAQRGRSHIVDAATRIAARDGLAAVTMRRVAGELGTGAASLYRHLASREDLLDLMIDRALADYTPPALLGDALDDVVADLIERVRFLRNHPWLIDALDERPSLSPQRIRLMEIGLERLAGHPAPGATKIEALTVAAGMVSIQVRHEQAGRTLDPDVSRAQIALLHQAAAENPHLATALGEPPPEPTEAPDERFARVLRGTLQGLLG